MDRIRVGLSPSHSENTTITTKREKKKNFFSTSPPLSIFLCFIEPHNLPKWEIKNFSLSPFLLSLPDE